MSPSQQKFPVLPRDAASILASVLQHQRRLLVFGAPGVGKSTLVGQLAQQLAHEQRACYCLSADPGSPLFGIPGAVSLGHWQQGEWQLLQQAALCSLDAGRFRLPLIAALQPLLAIPIDGSLLVDGPGVVRGVSGRELLQGLLAVTQVDGILVVVPEGAEPPLPDELQALALALDLDVFMIPAAEEARRPGKPMRARGRTQQWQAYLGEGMEQHFDLGALNIIGTPPPVDVASAWSGRQVALLHEGKTLAMGEVQQVQGEQITLSVNSRCRAFRRWPAGNRPALADRAGGLFTAHGYPAQCGTQQRPTPGGSCRWPGCGHDQWGVWRSPAASAPAPSAAQYAVRSGCW